jgi:hypothetical protein
MQINLKSVFLATALLLSIQNVAGQVITDCIPSPVSGAVEKDCLELIRQHIGGNSDEKMCKLGTLPDTLTLRTCIITTVCTKDGTYDGNDEVVRRALTVIGKCALKSQGTVAGCYTAGDGVKTCIASAKA